MKNLNLLLLEDNLDDAIELTSILSANNYNVTTVKDVEEADRKIIDQQFDIMILDIMIHGKPDGIAFAQKIHEIKPNTPFLFLTSMQSKGIFDKAKYTKPINYILKPYNELELLYALELAIETHYGQTNTISLKPDTAIVSPKFLFIKKHKSVVKINTTSINYIKVDEKYCNLLCDDGSYSIKMSLKRISELLSNPNFKQVHRNFLVNIEKIKELYFEDNLIILESKEQIPLSDRYKVSFLKNNNVFR